MQWSNTREGEPRLAGSVGLASSVAMYKRWNGKGVVNSAARLAGRGPGVIRMTDEGLNTSEVMRCLKRYVARQVFKHLPQTS